jgi:alpha-amylase
MGSDRPEKFRAIEVDQEDRLKEVSEVQEIEGWTGQFLLFLGLIVVQS